MKVKYFKEFYTTALYNQESGLNGIKEFRRYYISAEDYKRIKRLPDYNFYSDYLYVMDSEPPSGSEADRIFSQVLSILKKFKVEFVETTQPIVGDKVRLTPTDDFYALPKEVEHKVTTLLDKAVKILQEHAKKPVPEDLLRQLFGEKRRWK